MAETTSAVASIATTTLSARGCFAVLCVTCCHPVIPLSDRSKNVSIATAASVNMTSEARVVIESKPIGVSTRIRPSRITTSTLIPTLRTNFASWVVPFQKNILTTAKPGMKNMKGIPKTYARIPPGRARRTRVATIEKAHIAILWPF
ncbi:MAG: hypothetical protein MUO81_06340 [Thermoplasmata archaeon]|nr:hypothetical protein [Thermoplasmata archaeon]